MTASTVLGRRHARLDLHLEALLLDRAADGDELLQHADLAAAEERVDRAARARAPPRAARVSSSVSSARSRISQRPLHMTSTTSVDFAA